ncbi:hypothetical protein RND81_10G246700 [Saponaria officinalis]|uniref:Rho termination factor N-terminal domain-containing protein n=1 Tax=Saponaria officinalis TaxID=3572 RepID=A0AAW1I840_SAPOF
MSQTLNIITNLQGYGPSETSLLPCFGVSGRAISISPSAGREFKPSHMKILSGKRSLIHATIVCKAGSGAQRRNPDFPRQNRHIFSRNRNRYNDERENSENLDESEFVSTKNGPILSVTNSSKANATAAPGQKEKEIVELFRKVQAQLREKAAVKEEKRFETVKGQNKETETVDSLLKLLRKHSAEQGKRKVNGGNAGEYNIDQPRYTRKPSEARSRSSSSSSNNLVKEDPIETQKPSVGRPVSNFRRRSPVPRVKYEPIVSSEDTYDSITESDLNTNPNGAHYEPVPDFDSESESESDMDPDLDITSGLDQEDEQEEEEQEDEQEDDEPEIELAPEIEVSNKVMLETEFSDTEEDVYDEKDTEEQHTELKDLNAMKLVELRTLAKARGMKGFSKLKKSALIGLLSDDSSIP